MFTVGKYVTVEKIYLHYDKYVSTTTYMLLLKLALGQVYFH
jgi:hypothetical protein